MALIKCAECGREVSSLATSCPNCGFPVQKSGLESGQTIQAEANNSSGTEADKGCAVMLLVGIAATFALAVGVTTCSGEHDSTKNSPEQLAKSVTAYCQSEAGIPDPEDSPNHAITPSEMAKFTECVDKQMYGK